MGEPQGLAVVYPKFHLEARVDAMSTTHVFATAKNVQSFRRTSYSSTKTGCTSSPEYALLAEQNDAWLACQHRYSSEAWTAKILTRGRNPRRQYRRRQRHKVGA